VEVALGSDVAGGYTLDIMTAMRCAVTTSRMREGHEVVKQASNAEQTAVDRASLNIDWKEALFIATRGGALALGRDFGLFKEGFSFDAQQIQLFQDDGEGIGLLDLFGQSKGLDAELLEKWWCLGDCSNRQRVWVQGKRVM